MLADAWSEPKRESELELTAGQYRPSARVLTEARVAHKVDVAAREQVLIVEHVEHVGPELDVVRPNRELFAHREVGVVDEHAARRVPPSWRARLAAARVAGRAETGTIANRVAGITDRVRRPALAVRHRAEAPAAEDGPAAGDVPGGARH